MARYPLISVPNPAIPVITCIWFIASCGTSYHYYYPPVNDLPFNRKGEMLVTGMAGNTGMAVQGGYAMGDRVGLSVSTFNGRQLDYRSSEYGFAFHVTRIDSNDARFMIRGGYHTGENYAEKGSYGISDFRGRMQIPYVQFAFGTASTRPVIGKKTYGDISISFSVHYLSYNGFVATSVNGVPMEKPFSANNFFYVPHVAFMLGGRRVKLEWSMGFPYKKRYGFDENLKVFPFETHAGVVVLMGRKYRKSLEEYFKNK